MASPRSKKASASKHSQERRPPRESAPVAVPSLPTQPWGRSDVILISLILLVSGLLRLLNLDYMEFKGDEAGNLFLASQLASGESFPLVGIGSSIGTYNPPFFTYLMAIPLLFSRNPVVAAGFVALLNCAAVGLSYAFCRRFFNQRVAVVAALFFAVNPWAVLYSRKIWQQDALPLFVIGFFYSLFAVVCEGRRKALVGCFAFLAAMTQLHLSSIYYLVLLAIVLVWFRPRVGWGYYAGGVGVAVLLYAPYILFDILNQGYNLELYLQATDDLPFQFRPEALIAPFVLGSTLGFIRFLDWTVLDLLQGLLVAAGMVYLFFRWRERNYLILLLWLCVPLLFFSVSKLGPQVHYFIFFYPIQFLLLGILADALIRRLPVSRKALGYGIAALLVLLATYQLQSSVKFVTAIKDQEDLAWTEYGPPFRFRVEEIRKLVQQGVVEPQQVQEKLLEGKSPEATLKYDFPATEYIVLNLGAIP